jgi:NAD(P)-dependent dehydrogenase (short-subunit alcohol dehydrogenase family)
MDAPIDLRAKTCVVTGATSGIGLEVARQLAARGATVIGVGRDPARCEAAARRLGISCEVADLSSLAEVRRLAGRIAALAPRLDVLVNNAGTFSFVRRETVDGLELTFAVNHLASFLLTNLLLARLEAAGEARVVIVSSGSHYAGQMHWDDLGLRRGFSGLKAYDQSKLATVLFVRELARRLGPASPVSAYAVDPGLVRTDIGLKGTRPLVRLVWRLRSGRGIDPAMAAESVAWCAVSEEAAGSTGLYWKERRPVEPSARARDDAAARRLWEESEALCGMRHARAA